MNRISWPNGILLGAIFCAGLVGAAWNVVGTTAQPSSKSRTLDRAPARSKGKSPLRLELTVPPGPLTTGRMITVTAHLHNTSPRLAEGADEDTILRGFTVQVLHDGRAVPMTAYARKHRGPVTFAERSIAVAPNGTLSYRLALGGLYDMSEPGKYAVRVSYLIDPYSGETLTVKPLAIEVTEAPLVSALPMSAKDRAAVNAALMEAVNGKH